MTTLLFAFGAMLMIIGGMAVGVLFGRAPIKGSCGGMSAVGIDAECEICGGNPARCEATASTNSSESESAGAKPNTAPQSALGYDAARPDRD